MGAFDKYSQLHNVTGETEKEWEQNWGMDED